MDTLAWAAAAPVTCSDSMIQSMVVRRLWVAMDHPARSSGVTPAPPQDSVPRLTSSMVVQRLWCPVPYALSTQTVAPVGRQDPAIRLDSIPGFLT